MTRIRFRVWFLLVLLGMSGGLAHAENGTTLLDIQPVDCNEAQAQNAYKAVGEALGDATDLAPIKAHAPGKRHPLAACRSLDNTPCLLKLAQSARTHYVVYGELRALDDTLLLLLNLMDTTNGRVVESVRKQIANPATLEATSRDATCQLTRLYGCDHRPAAKAAPAVVALAAPQAASAAPAASVAPTPAASVAAVPSPVAVAQTAKPAESDETSAKAAPAAVAPATKAPQVKEPDVDRLMRSQEKRKAQDAALDDDTPAKPVSAPAPVAVVPTASPSAPPVQAKAAYAPPLTPMRKGAIALWSVSGASLGAGVAFSLLAKNEYDSYNRATAAKEAKDDKSRTKRDMYISFAGYGLAAAALGSGVALWIVGAPKPERKPKLYDVDDEKQPVSLEAAPVIGKGTLGAVALVHF